MYSTPDRYSVGAHGWVKVKLDDGMSLDVLAAWVDESHQLLARGPKKVAKRTSG